MVTIIVRVSGGLASCHTVSRDVTLLYSALEVGQDLGCMGHSRYSLPTPFSILRLSQVHTPVSDVNQNAHVRSELLVFLHFNDVDCAYLPNCLALCIVIVRFSAS